MKRIKSACLEQTIHFMLKDGMGSAMAKKEVQQEYEKYKIQLEHNRTKYKILEENPQSDGSIIIKIKKQYNNHNIGEYFE